MYLVSLVSRLEREEFPLFGMFPTLKMERNEGVVLEPPPCQGVTKRGLRRY